MSNERSFQQYFMKAIPHGYRISLTTGGGFPDTLLIKGKIHFLVELKCCFVGVSGNKKLRGLFKKTQPPWYADYLKKGGRSLYVVFKLNKGYGILKANLYFLKNLNTVKYLDLLNDPGYDYREYGKLTELIKEEF